MDEFKKEHRGAWKYIDAQPQPINGNIHYADDPIRAHFWVYQRFAWYSKKGYITDDQVSQSWIGVLPYNYRRLITLKYSD